MSVLPSDPINANTNKRFCYGYSTLNWDHVNLQCDGVQMSRYEYVLEFSAEGEVNFPVRGPAPGQTGSNHGYSNCIPGPLK